MATASPKALRARGANAREWLRDFFEAEFQPAKLAKDGGQTRKVYIRAINRFESFLGHRPKLRDLTGPNLESFRVWLDANGYGARARDGNPKTIKAIWKFAADTGRLSQAPRDGRTEFTQEWVDAAKHRGAPVTLRHSAVSQSDNKLTRSAINQFHRFLAREPLIADIGRATVEGFAKWFINQGATQENAARYMGLLSSLCNSSAQVDVRPVAPPQPAHAPSGPDLPLVDLLGRYAAGRDITRGAVKALRTAINAYSLHLGRMARLADFSKESVNAWLESEISRTARRTARNYRAGILTLWRWGHDEDLTAVAPVQIRLIRSPLPPVAAYTPDEVRLLVKACDTLDDKFYRGRVPRKLLYRALIQVTWDTGFRPGDLMRLRWENVADNGCVQIVQNKTGGQATRWLNRDTMAALRQIRIQHQSLVFGGHTTLETLRFVFRKLKLEAGIARGTFKWLRRAMATQIAISHGDSVASRALGHKTADMARKHYIDASQITTGQVLTPPLAMEGGAA